MLEISEFRYNHLGPSAALYVQCFNAAPWHDRWVYSSALRRLGDIYRTPGFFGIVAGASGVVKGAALGNIEQWFGGFDFHLRELFVDQEARGQGVGSQLLDRLEQILDKKVGSIYLLTAGGTIAEKFYRGQGYSRVKRMVTMSKKI